jgi:hypothetical protein
VVRRTAAAVCADCSKKDLTREKETFYRYLSFVPDAAAEAERFFWSGQIALIKPGISSRSGRTI